MDFIIKEHWNNYQTIGFYREPVEINYSIHINTHTIRTLRTQGL